MIINLTQKEVSNVFGCGTKCRTYEKANPIMEGALGTGLCIVLANIAVIAGFTQFVTTSLFFGCELSVLSNFINTLANNNMKLVSVEECEDK